MGFKPHFSQCLYTDTFVLKGLKSHAAPLQEQNLFIIFHRFSLPKKKSNISIATGLERFLLYLSQDIHIQCTYFRNIHKPLAPVRLVEIVFFCVYVYLSEVDLWSVPATDPVISSKIALNRKVISLGLVPLGKDEHVFTFLMCKPGYRHLRLQGFIVPKTNFDRMSKIRNLFPIGILSWLKVSCNSVNRE